MKTRKCLVCGTGISGRSDKKYCSDQCRSYQNNHPQNGVEEIILATQKILRKNRMILKKLCPDRKAVVHREALTALEFQFQFFTSFHVSPNNKFYFIFYDYALSPINDPSGEKAVIVRWKELRTNFNPWKFVKND